MNSCLYRVYTGIAISYSVKHRTPEYLMVLDNLNSWMLVIKHGLQHGLLQSLEILSLVQSISQKKGGLYIPSCYGRKTE